MGIFSKPKTQQAVFKDRPAMLSDLITLNENMAELMELVRGLGNGHSESIQRIKEVITIPETPGLSEPVKEVSFLEAVQQLQPKQEPEPVKTDRMAAARAARGKNKNA